MGIEHHHKPDDRGATFRPPRMKIYRGRVNTISPSDDPADQEYTLATWSSLAPEFSWHPLTLFWGTSGQMTTLQMKVVLGQGIAQATRLRAEDEHCSPGDKIELIEMAPGAGPEDKFAKTWFTGYLGQSAMLIQAHPDVESVTLTAYGPELRLSHKVITGMWCANTDEAFLGMKGSLTAALAVRSNVWEARLPVIMNPKGMGNAWGGDTSETGSASLDWQLTSNTEAPGGYEPTAADNECKVFTSPGATAKKLVSEHWTAYTALRSVVEWVDNYDVISYQRTNWEWIAALLGDTPIREVNLTGKNLLQAMSAILAPVGFGFAIEPWGDKRGEHKLMVFKLQDPDEFALANMAPVVGGNVVITSVAGQSAMVQRVDFLRDSHNVKNHIIIMGATKLTERSLDFDYNGAGVLQPAWDLATYDIDDYDDGGIIGGEKWASAEKKLEWLQRYTIVDGSDYLDYSRAFRAFAWNEDGGLSTVVKDGAGDPIVPTLTNFSSGADSQKAQYRPRPPQKRVKYTDAQGAGGGTAGSFEPPAVFVGIAGDSDSWVKVAKKNYNLDTSRCLIHFTVADVATWKPWDGVTTESGSDTLAKLYGSLNFATALWNSLTAYGSNELTIRLTAGFEMDDATTYDLPRALDSSWPFDARAVVRLPQRFHYRDIDGDVSDSEAAAIDDEVGDPMFDYATRARDSLEDATGHGSVVLRGLHRYQPGVGLRQLAGRNVDLTVSGRRQKKAASIAPLIVGVAWHFTQGVNKTELLLETGSLALPR